MAEPKLPPPSFDVLMQVLAAPCMVHLGAIANPASGRTEKNLEQARWTIDLLHVLEEKCRASLTETERSKIDTLLHQLRGAYASVSAKG